MKTKILFILTGVIVVPFGIIVGGRLPYFLLYIYLLTTLIPFLHCLITKYYLIGNINIPVKDLVSGEEIKIKYDIINPLPFSLPRLEVENSIARKLTGREEQSTVFSLKPRDSISEETVVVCRRRGIYQVGEINIYIKDIFNLFSIKKTIKTPIALKIYPQATPIQSLAVDTSPDLTSFLELREYREGDSIKKIHWMASAKKDVFMVKEYEEKGEEEVVLILDSSIKSYHKDPNGWIEDKAVDVTISMVQHFLQQNIGITLYYQEGHKIVAIKGNHLGFLKLFMEKMIAFTPTGGGAFNQYLEEVISEINYGCTLFLITPVLNKEIGAKGIRLRGKNLQPRYIVLGDEGVDAFTWKENKKFAQILDAEGIATYMIGAHQDIRSVLEGKYANG